MTRLLGLAFVGMLLALPSSAEQARRPLLPTAAPILQQAFERMKPGLRYEEIKLDHDHVHARLCDGDQKCFAVRLDAPDGCATPPVGPFCLSFPEGAPSTAVQEVIANALKESTGAELWGPLPAPAPEVKAAPVLAVRPVPAAEKAPLLIAWIAIGLVLAWLSRPGAPRGWAASIAELVGAVLVSGLSFIWLRHMNLRPVVSNEPFLYVVDCLLFNRCFTIGPGSSVILNNGVLWEDILLAVRTVGGDPLALYNTVLGMLAAGVGLVFLATARLVHPGLAVPAALLALALIGPASLASPLLDSSTTLLFCVLAGACLLLYAVSAWTEALVLGAACIAQGMNGHVSVVSLLPALLTLPVLAASAPWRSLFIAVASYFVAASITSLQAVEGNLQVMRTSGLWPVVSLGVAGLVAAASMMRVRFQRLSLPGRASIALACLALPHLAGMLLLLLMKHPVLPGYISPLVLPASLAGALLLAVRRAWLAVLLPLAVATVVLALEPWRDLTPHLLPRDVEQVGPEPNQMTPVGVNAVRHLTERIREGALGPANLVSMRYTFKGLSSEGAIRLELTRGDQVRGFLLLRPPDPEAASRPRYFVLFPDDDMPASETDQLAVLIDSVFKEDPWAPEPPPATGVSPPIPVGRTRTFLGLGVVVATVLAGIGILLRTRLRLFA